MVLIQPKKTVSEQVQELTSKDWKVISDGPTGVQLAGPKKMRGLDKACLVVGILTSWLYGFGLLLVILALLDYWLMTKPETKFIPRDR